MTRSLQHAPERERAYQFAKDGLTISTISEMLGIPRGTIGRWSKEDGWRARIAEERQMERLRVANQLNGFLATEIVQSFHHIRHLRDNARNETIQLQAAKFLIESAKDIESMIARMQAGEVVLPDEPIDGTPDFLNGEFDAAALEASQRLQLG